MIATVVGWTVGDGTGHERYSAADYFRGDIYLGPDHHGIEPIFRDATEEEAAEFLAKEIPGKN